MENAFEFWTRMASESLDVAIKFEEDFLRSEKTSNFAKVSKEACEFFLNDAVESEKIALKFKK